MKGIGDLANHLGLTVGTVSRALNDRPEVSLKTRKRVQAAAAELGYVPNQSGRALRKGATNTVGFMLESGTAFAVGGDNFFHGVIAGLQQTLEPRRLDLILLPCAATEDPHEFLRRMVSRRIVDGLVISATQRQDPRIALLVQSRIPFVALGRSGDVPEHAWIDLDFAGVAKDAVSRLVGKGHRRIAAAVPASEINLRYVFTEGYRAALARNAIDFDPNLVLPVELSEAGGAALADRLLALPSRPSAVLLVNELLAIGLYHRLAQLGIQPGRDIAVIGFRENPQARFLSPHLGSYRLSLADLGIALGQTLLSRIDAAREARRPEPVGRLWPMDYAPGESEG
ncbi:substrate-binding domain-containing protein [Aureimonas leprariae]|uniref:LacI family transcriptional regulator n=1 Tax=Plantimonas leprariae TaxID=2615207 RepID=A0A7V7TV75_9HYPH|nr:substrate-binding domain-containing protein [Aureimonas leprariae]KAB0677395.1 LacI family transcriptional regulator [Aureimonas leprariae]